jgi:hypothetical protein
MEEYLIIKSFTSRDVYLQYPLNIDLFADGKAYLELKANPSLSQYRLPISTYNFINNIILIGP